MLPKVDVHVPSPTVVSLLILARTTLIGTTESQLPTLAAAVSIPSEMPGDLHNSTGTSLKSRSRPEVLGHQPRVLIVDDERQNRELLEVMLAPEGFVLLTAASGEEALAIVAQQPPDLVLLDIMMPAMDGYEVAIRIKEGPAARNIPIIMVTALDDREAKMRGLHAGAEDFVTNPVDRAELVVRVRNLLRLKAYGDYHDQHSRMLEDDVASRIADLAENERLYRSTFDEAPAGITHVGVTDAVASNQHLCDLAEIPQRSSRPTAFMHLQSEELPAKRSYAVRYRRRADRYVIDESRIDAVTATYYGPESRFPFIATPQVDANT